MQHKRQDHSDTKMQKFTKENFYLFPVISYDYTGDDGRVISIADIVFTGDLGNAIDYTQSKALHIAEKQLSLLTAALPVALFGLLASMSHYGADMMMISFICIIITAILCWKIFSLDQYKKAIEHSFDKVKNHRFNAQSIKLATFKDVEGFACPEKILDAVKQFPSQLWDQVGLGRYYSSQDMFSVIILIALSSPNLHHKALEIVKEIPEADEKKKIESIYKLCLLIT